MADPGWRDAIIEVLENEDEPVHYAEIASRIIEGGIKTTVGATPAATVAATISQSRKFDGDQSPFEKVARGHYRLRSKARPGIAIEIELDEVPDSDVETGFINAFGMYWQRDRVNWAAPKILGQQQRGSAVVDFAAQRGVYLLHDRREVVYVGRTNAVGIGGRLKSHTQSRLGGRWDRFSWFGIYRVKDDSSLVESNDIAVDVDTIITTMEALLIEALEPPQNRRRGDTFQAVEFLQAIDPSVDSQQQMSALVKTLLAGSS